MSDIKPGINVDRVNVDKLRIIADRWRKANIPGSNIDLNKLADDTLKIIDSEPLIKEVCTAFLCSISIHAIKDPKFDEHPNSNTMKKTINVNTRR